MVPPHRVATGWAFRELDALPVEEASSLDLVLERYRTGGALALGSCAQNSFERVVVPRYALHSRVAAALAAAGARWVRLTGSGSALFGVFEGSGTARAAAARVGEQFPEVEAHAFEGARQGVYWDGH